MTLVPRPNKYWFEQSAGNGLIVLQTGLRELSVEEVKHIVQILRFGNTPGINDISSCGIVLTVVLNVQEDVFTHIEFDRAAMYDMVRTELAKAILHYCPDKLRRHTHRDKYAHLRPALALVHA